MDSEKLSTTGKSAYKSSQIFKDYVNLRNIILKKEKIVNQMFILMFNNN